MVLATKWLDTPLWSLTPPLFFFLLLRQLSTAGVMGSGHHSRNGHTSGGPWGRDTVTSCDGTPDVSLDSDYLKIGDLCVILY